jgi:hypothetical protein
MNMPKPMIAGELRVNVWNLLSDGIYGPIKSGLYRSQKHGAVTLTPDQEDVITENIHNAMMTWFTEAFIFGDENES